MMKLQMIHHIIRPIKLLKSKKIKNNKIMRTFRLLHNYLLIKLVKKTEFVIWSFLLMVVSQSQQENGHYQQENKIQLK